MIHVIQQKPNKSQRRGCAPQRIIGDVGQNMKLTLLVLLLFPTALIYSADEKSQSATDDDPILMRPFAVFAPGIDIRVIYDKNQCVVRIEVTKVVANSRAAKAGFTTSMWITKIQSVVVYGLTKEELFSRAFQQSVTDAHVLTVIDLKARGKTREIKIPVADPERK